MGRKLSPGAEGTGKLTGITGSPDRDLTFTTDNVVVRKPQTTKSQQEVQGNKRRHNAKYMTGSITLTLVTDDPDGTAEWLQGVEDATMVLNLANNRQFTAIGVTHATEEGVTEGLTEGTTNELTFTFQNYTDRDIS